MKEKPMKPCLDEHSRYLSIMLCGLDYFLREANELGLKDIARLLRDTISRTERILNDHSEETLDNLIADGEFIQLLDFYHHLRKVPLDGLSVVGKSLRENQMKKYEELLN